jgi:hypothetical protein
MQQPFSQFIPVEVIDEDGQGGPEDSVCVSLPAIPRWGDTIVLKDGDIMTGGYLAATVTDVVYYARESSSETLHTYVHVFVSYRLTRDDLLEGNENAEP